MNRFRFIPNVPQIVSLQVQEGDYDPDADQTSYLLSDGRTLMLHSPDAARLNILDLKPGESFGICKRWDGDAATKAHIDIWLAPATEMARAEAEQQIEAPAVPQRKPKTARRKKVEEIRTAPAPVAAMPQGTGTHGPAPIPRPAIIAAVKPSGRIPWNIAFQEVTRFVTDGLNAAGEQWSDAAKQDMISTVLISASREGALTLWERHP